MSVVYITFSVHFQSVTAERETEPEEIVQVESLSTVPGFWCVVCYILFTPALTPALTCVSIDDKWTVLDTSVDNLQEAL